MRLVVIVSLLCAAAGGFYFYVESQPKPVKSLPALPPPPPPPPPPPELSTPQAESARQRLFDVNVSIRRETLEGLSSYVGKEAEKLIIDRMRFDEDRSIRQLAIQILQRRKAKLEPGLEDKRVSAMIVPALNDLDPEVRMTALMALRDLEARSLADRITLSLYDSETLVKREAILTLNAFLQKHEARLTYKLPPQYESVWQTALAHSQKR